MVGRRRKAESAISLIRTDFQSFWRCLAEDSMIIVGVGNCTLESELRCPLGNLVINLIGSGIN